MEFRESGNNFSEDNFTGENRTDSPMENIPVRVLTAKTILGDKIDDGNGEHLGDIEDIMLNIGTGAIEYIVMKSGGFLGFGGKLFAIPFEHLRIDEADEKFVLNYDKEIFEKAPGFDKDHWPKTNSRHLEDVRTYWTNVIAVTTGKPGKETY